MIGGAGGGDAAVGGVELGAPGDDCANANVEADAVTEVKANPATNTLKRIYLSLLSSIGVTSLN
jgi:hypothetical protein